MAGKTFINNSIADFQITLFIREKDNLVQQEEKIFFTLNAGETKIITIAKDQSAILNGVLFYTLTEGDIYSKIQLTTKESELDELLNTNETIYITKVETDYVISGKNKFLDAVNEAQTARSMREAIENLGIDLYLTVYNDLTEAKKEQVAMEMIKERPADGYHSLSSVQSAQDEAINRIVDQNYVVVHAGSIGGDGSKAHPFGTISEGLAAVNPNGIVIILAGIYPVHETIIVKKAGVTLKGEVGSVLTVQADIIALMILANSTSVDGLTITSDIPYAQEFIQVGGSDVRLINNNIFGPKQDLSLSNWIGNHAVMTQGGIENLMMENNTFHSLQTALYINPDVTGICKQNVVYNTKVAFIVDRGYTRFVENAWGVPPNEVDIALLAGTTLDPPYKNLVIVSAENDKAIISDQRSMYKMNVMNTKTKESIWKQIFRKKKPSKKS